METNLQNILNPDTKIRTEATELINRICRENPDQTAQELLKLILRKEENTKTKEIASLVLHKNILSKSDLFPKIPPANLTTISEKLTQLVFSEPSLNLNFVQRSAEIIIEIAVKQNSHSSIMQNLKALTENKNSGNEKLIKIFVLYCIELLCEFTVDQTLLMNFSGNFLGYIQSAMGDNDLEVRIGAAVALTMLMNRIKDKNYLNNFSSMLKPLTQLMVEVVKQKNQEQGVKIINTFDDLVIFQPKFLVSSCEELVFLFTEIFASEEISDPVRIAALNFLSSYAKYNGLALRKSENFNNKTLVSLFQCLMKSSTEDLEDEADGNAQDFVQGSLSQKSISGAIIMTLSIFSQNLSCKYFFSKMMPFCKEALGTTDWRAQHSALVIIGVLAQGTKKHYLADLEGLMVLILPFLKADHPKALFSCLTCIGLLCDEYCPELQQRFGNQILPALIELMNRKDQGMMKLNLRAVSCLINFTRECLKNEDEDNTDVNKIFSNYFDSLNQSIINLFKYSVDNNDFIMLSEVLSLLSILSNLMKEKFAVHYSLFMNNIKELISNLNNKELNIKQKNLRCQLIDTAGFLISANSKNMEQIKNDIEQLTSYLQNLLSSLDDENSQLKSILNFFSTIAVHLGEFFLPMFESVFNLAMNLAKKEVKVHFEDTETFVDKGENFQSLPLDLKIFGGKKVLSINHNILELKLTGFTCLYKLTKIFKDKLTDQQKTSLITLIGTHIEETHPSAVKKLCFKTMRYLLETIDYKSAVEIFEKIIPSCISFARKYFGSDNQEDLAYFLYKIIKLIKVFTKTKIRGIESKLPALPSLALLSQFNKDILEESERLKKDLIQEYNGYDLKDPDVMDELEENMQFYCGLDQKVMELNGEIVKFELPEEIDQFIITNIGSIFNALANNPRDSLEVLYPMCFYTDIMEFGSDKAFNCYFELSVEYCLKVIENPKYNQDDDIVQTLFFFLGCAMLRVAPNSQPVVAQKVIDLLTKFLSNPGVMDESKELLIENAIAAMIKVFMNHSESLLQSDEKCTNTLRELFSKLPLLNDCEESVVVNRYIMLKLKENNRFVAGNDERKEITKLMFNKIKEELVKHNGEDIVDDMTKNFLNSF